MVLWGGTNKVRRPQRWDVCNIGVTALVPDTDGKGAIAPREQGRKHDVLNYVYPVLEILCRNRPIRIFSLCPIFKELLKYSATWSNVACTSPVLLS